MAFLNSPILKARRAGTLSPETQRKFQLARDKHAVKPEMEDFKKLHQNIAGTTKSFTLLGFKASENALKRISMETKKHSEKLEILKEGFNKVKVNEKLGYDYDEKVVTDVRDKISMLDPAGGMTTTSLSFSRPVSSELSCASTTLVPTSYSEQSVTLKPFEDTENLFDTDTESLLSDFDMEVINSSFTLEDLDGASSSTSDSWEPDVESSHLSQKSVILSASGMYTIEQEEGEYTMVSEVKTAWPAGPPFKELPFLTGNEVEAELRLEVGDCCGPLCATCAAWDASTWLSKEEEEGGRASFSPLNMTIDRKDQPVEISVEISPVLPRKNKEEDVVEDKEDETLQLYLANLNRRDNVDSVSVSESLETRSTESYEYEKSVDSNFTSEDESEMCYPAVTTKKAGVLKRFLHSASADLTRFSLRRSSSTAVLKTTRSSSTCPSYIPRPDYDLARSLLPGGPGGGLNLDTRLRLRNRRLVDVQPLARWDKKPIFAMTTSGHKAWYQKAQDLIESRRREMANMDEDNNDRDIDILVGYFYTGPAMVTILR